MSGLETIAIIGGVASLVGSGIQAAGQIQQGKASKKAAYDIARQEELQGKDQLAAAQREAQEVKQQGQLIMSRQRAVAAASGAGGAATAPTVAKIMADTEAQTKYASDVKLYQGRKLRDELFFSAKNRRKTGNANYIGSLFGAAGTFAGGIGTAVSRIG